MSHPIWCEIACFECGETTAGTWTYGAIPRAGMTAEAKRKGWRITSDGIAKEWLCPGCKPKMEPRP